MTLGKERFNSRPDPATVLCADVHQGEKTLTPPDKTVTTRKKTVTRTKMVSTTFNKTVTTPVKAFTERKKTVTTGKRRSLSAAMRSASRVRC